MVKSFHQFVFIRKVSFVPSTFSSSHHVFVRVHNGDGEHVGTSIVVIIVIIIVVIVIIVIVRRVDDVDDSA